MGPTHRSLARRNLSTAHFPEVLRFFVSDAGTPTVDSREVGSLPLPLGLLVGLIWSALAGSAATLPPSFSHRSSIFFFNRFLAIGSGIAVSFPSLLLPYNGINGVLVG